MSDNGRETETCSILSNVEYIKLSVAVNTNCHCFITTPTNALFFKDVTVSWDSYATHVAFLPAL